MYQANLWGAYTVLWPIRKTKRMWTDHRYNNGNIFKNLMQRLITIRIFVHTLLLSVYCFHHWNRIFVSLSDYISTISPLLLILKFMRNEIESQFLLYRIIKWDWQLMNKFYKVFRYPNSVWAGLVLKLENLQISCIFNE